MGSAWSGFQVPGRPAGCWCFISMASQVYSPKFTESVRWSSLSFKMESLQSGQPAPLLPQLLKPVYPSACTSQHEKPAYHD